MEAVLVGRKKGKSTSRLAYHNAQAPCVHAKLIARPRLQERRIARMRGFRPCKWCKW